MKRRDFLVQGISAGLVTSAAVGFGGISSLASTPPPTNNWDLVAVRDGEPDIMFDRAIASMGGMTLA